MGGGLALGRVLLRPAGVVVSDRFEHAAPARLERRVDLRALAVDAAFAAFEAGVFLQAVAGMGELFAKMLAHQGKRVFPRDLTPGISVAPHRVLEPVRMIHQSVAEASLGAQHAAVVRVFRPAFSPGDPPVVDDKIHAASHATERADGRDNVRTHRGRVFLNSR